MSERAQSFALFTLRLTGLYLALAHGWGKIVGLASGSTAFVDGVAKLGFPWPAFFAWAAALAECAGGLLIAVGLLTRVGALFAGLAMAVAAFRRHHLIGHLLVAVGLTTPSEETIKGWGNPELATLYMLVMLAVLVLGPGGWSIDARLRKRRR